MVANARISAMAEMVAETLGYVVDEIVVNDGWYCVPIEEWDGDIDNAAWLLDGCAVLDVYTESCLIEPNGK